MSTKPTNEVKDEGWMMSQSQGEERGQDHGGLVPREVCEEWQAQVANGKSYSAIAEQCRWCKSTVSIHANGQCRHLRSSKGMTPDPDEVAVELRKFAAKRGRSFTARELTESDETDITESTCCSVFGSFSAAMETVGIPMVQGTMNDQVRKMLYKIAVADDPTLLPSKEVAVNG